MRTLALALLAATIALPAAAQGPAGQCFRLSQMRNHKADGASTLYAKVGMKDVWRFDMAGACLTTVTSDGLIVTPTAGQDLICGPLDLDIKVRSGAMVSPCIISRLTKLTPQEAAALPKKARP